MEGRLGWWLCAWRWGSAGFRSDERSRRRWNTSLCSISTLLMTYSHLLVIIAHPSFWTSKQRFFAQGFENGWMYQVSDCSNLLKVARLSRHVFAKNPLILATKNIRYDSIFQQPQPAFCSIRRLYSAVSKLVPVVKTLQIIPHID